MTDNPLPNSVPQSETKSANADTSADDSSGVNVTDIRAKAASDAVSPDKPVEIDSSANRGQTKIPAKSDATAADNKHLTNATETAAQRPDGTPHKSTKWQWLIKKFRDPIWQGIGGVVAIVTLLLAILTLIQSSASLPKPTPAVTRMSGDFRVAVAGFAVDGQPGNSDIGTELADGVYLNLKQAFEDLNLGFQITVREPEKVGTIHGATSEERAKSAQELAEKIGADVVVYGVMDVTNPVWKVTPEFFVATQNFYEAEEIVGEHEFGESIALPGQNDAASRIGLSSKLKARLKALSKITIGLAFYATRDYQKALETFQSAESIEEWTDEQGKYVLYLLLGNAAGKQKDLDLAKAYYEKSLAIDREYARPYVGLGTVYYLLALQPFQQSNNPVDTDQDLLDMAIDTYRRALEAGHQPALSDISTKVHFGLGQSYFAKTYAGQGQSYDAAVSEFQYVISAYANGINPRVRQLASGAHARLGLIYDLTGNTVQAIEEYQVAATLIYDDPETQSQYLQRSQALKRELGTQTQ
jgi:tetratricopeptide (TPR) repeat protein